MFLYCNSPLINCSILTANSIIFTELYGCTIKPKSNVTFTGLHVHRISSQALS